jgi:hypothetical protein
MIAALARGLAEGIVSVLPGLATSIGNTIVKSKETEAARQGNENQNGKDITLQWLTSVNDTNRIKAENQTERQIVFALIAFATPTAIIYWAALIDGLPFYIPLFMDSAHKVGSWKVAIPPGLEATYFKIIDSFFIAGPAVASAALLAKAFRRK